MGCARESCQCGDALVPLRAGRLSRRDFLQLLGAAGLAGLPACERPPPEEVAPYVHAPELVRPGQALHFATALAYEGAVTGVVVTSHEGKPTKVEGNPAHPASLGAAGAWEQAAVLELYDPLRLSSIRERNQPMAREALRAELARLAASHDADRGAGLQLLLAPTTSPLMAALLARLRERFPRAAVRTYRPVDRGLPFRAARLAYGRPLLARPRLDRADVVIALDADFISFGPERLRLARELAGRRTDPKTISRIYAVETQLSVAGALADARVAARPSELPAVARALLSATAQRLGRADVVQALRRVPLAPPLQSWVDSAAEDLAAHRGRAIVLPGESAPMPLQLAAIALNALVAGDALELSEPSELDPEAGPLALEPLVEAARSGAVRTLLCTAFDPVYTAPADLDVGAALARVENVFHLALVPDQTAPYARVVVPRSHALESWADVRAADGTTSIVQPLIAPLGDSLTDVELLDALLEAPGRSAYELLRESYRAQLGNDHEARWRAALQAGVIAAPASGVHAEVQWAPLLEALAAALPPSPGPLELAFAPDRKVRDGELAHNPWLQECPDVITQLAWDNALLLNPATARKLNVGFGDLVELSHEGKTLTAPVYTLPGHAEGAATLHLGYGAAGWNGDVAGVDAYRLRTRSALAAPRGAELRKLHGTHEFPLVQVETSDQGRPIAMHAEVSNLEPELREVARHHVEQPSLYPLQPSGPYRWAMAIDLSRCVACSACVVACQAENNVPVVGPDEVRRGREMHWLRVDRYFAGSEQAPEVRFQPLMCVHCEDAPCEYVCPVNATVHSDEGLNEMVYNRCVGTRYCSNNCPYKVRRFNWRAYTDALPHRELLASNPEVTVRGRGVMEKCSYCVQRIEKARIAREIAGELIRDGDVRTACQQACPAEAIVFGSLGDLDARVTVLHGDPRRYDLLGELGTRPRTAYLARLTHKPREP